jgi:hypothetical protein
LSSALKATLPGDAGSVKSSDTGDGVFLVFPSTTKKCDLLEKFVPTFEQMVRQENSTATSSTKIFLRAVLHFGEYFLDQPILTKQGRAGKEINHTFRLLDSAELRRAVQKQGEGRPLALMVSDDVYQKIVVQQIPEMSGQFAKRFIRAKDGKITGWLYVGQSSIKTVGRSRSRAKSSSKHRKPQGSTNPPLFTPERGKQAHTLTTLPGVSIYISTADIHNYNLYRRGVGDGVPVANHLETALLLSDQAIVHCADPYRCQAVFDILSEFKYFIKKGNIVFLLSRSIESPQRDFESYVKGKENQYRMSGHGTADIATLSSQDTKTDIEPVVDLLELSPTLLHRGYIATESFVDAVQNDLVNTEVLGTTGNPLQGKLMRINLTLFQILSLAKITTTGNEPVVANPEVVERIINGVKTKINHHSFSRQILLSLIREELKNNGRPAYEGYSDLLEVRTNLLHLRINVGPHGFIELHPERERASPYNYNHLLNHLGVLADCAPKARFGLELVKALKSEQAWDSFATHHLSVMADSYSRRMGDMEVRPENYFIHSRRLPVFRNIAKVVRAKWK